MRITRLFPTFWACLLVPAFLFSQNFFTPLDGPFGISVNCLTANTGGALFVYSQQGNLFYSADNGDSWVPADSGAAASASPVRAFLTDPAGNTYLVGAQSLFRYDAGASAWVKVNLPATFNGVLNGTAVNPAGEVFAGDGNGRIFISTDQGATFQQVAALTGSADAEQIAAFSSAHNLCYGYMGGSSRLYHFSTDGVVQQVLSFQGTPKCLTYNTYTGTAFMASTTRVRRSTDGGLNWQDITPAQPYLGYIVQIRFSPSGRTWATNDQGKLFYSDNEGDTWVALDNPGAAYPYRAQQIAIAPDGTIFLAGSDWCGAGANAFARSTDAGATWTLLDRNFRRPTTTALVGDAAGRLYANTCSPGLLHSADAGHTWDQARLSPQGPELMRLAVGENGVVFAAAADNALYCSLNEGQSWTNVTPPNFTENATDLALSVAPNGVLHCLGLLTNYRSADFGVSWQAFPGVEVLGVLPTQFFYHPNGHVYIFQANTVYRSDNGGENWAPLFGDFVTIDAFHLAPNGDIWLYGLNGNTFNEGMFLSKNEGTTTTAQGFLNYGVKAIASNAGGDLFAVSQSNTLYRRNAGTGNWASLGPVTTNSATLTGLYTDPQQYLYACFDNDVVYRSAQPTAEAKYLRGQVLLDKDGNCQLNAGETPAAYWAVTASGPDTYTAFTRTDGRYTLIVPDGTYKINLTPVNDLWASCKNNVSVVFTASKDSGTVDFPAKIETYCPYPAVALSTPFLRRCWENTYYVRYCNEGTAPLNGAQLELLLDPWFDFVSAGLPVAAQNGKQVLLDVGDLQAGECGTVQVRFTLSCDAPLGEEHCMLARLLPETNCPLPSKAQMRDCRPNVGSYDPNDKTAFVDNREENARVAPDSLLEYQIRFQNTGTDTAFRVVIEDRLSPLLDARSVQPLQASHPFSLDIPDGRTLRFVFDPIALPDSNVNEPASHGFVRFRVAQRPGNLLGAELENRANIFFDGNAPVATNTVRLTLAAEPVGTQDAPPGQAGVRVYPNPFDASTMFEVLSPGTTEACTLWISDPLGRVVRRERFYGLRFRIERQGMPDGLYFFRVETNAGVAGSGKLVVRGE